MGDGIMGVDIPRLHEQKLPKFASFFPTDSYSGHRMNVMALALTQVAATLFATM